LNKAMAFSTTLARVAAAIGDAREPWWIIGSAAVVLHDAQTGVGDVDVLCGEADARKLLAALSGEARAGTGDGLFRSAVFGRCEGTPLPVDVMAGFAVRGEPVRLFTREWIACGGVRVPVPSRAELIALLRRFGRDKDLERVTLLERLPLIRSP
jgi:hypothetical protein